MGQPNKQGEAMYARMCAVLEQDRGMVAQRLGDRLRGRILDVLGEYVEADPEYAEIRVERQHSPTLGTDMALVIYVPIQGVKEERL